MRSTGFMLPDVLCSGSPLRTSCSFNHSTFTAMSLSEDNQPISFNDDFGRTCVDVNSCWQSLPQIAEQCLHSKTFACCFNRRVELNFCTSVCNECLCPGPYLEAMLPEEDRSS